MSHNLFRPLGEALWLTGKLAIKLTGMGIGAARAYMAKRMGEYNPQRLRDSGEIELHPEGVEIYTITLPKQRDWDAEQAERFISHLASISDFCLQIVATEHAIHWQIINWMELGEDTLQSVIASYFTDATVQVKGYAQSQPKPPFHRVVLPLSLGAIYPAPIRQATQIKQFDPLTVISQAMNQIRAGERVNLILLMTSAAPDVNKKGETFLTQSNLSAFEYLSMDGALFAEVRKMQGRDQQNVYTPELDKMMRNKLSKPLYHAQYLIQSEAKHEKRATQLLQNILPHLMHFANPPFNTLYPASSVVINEKVSAETNFATDSMGVIQRWLAGKDDTWKNHLLVLSASEMSALWHLPYDAFTSEQIEWIKSRQVPLPKALRQLPEGYLIGQNRYGMQTNPVYLPEENFTMHTAIIGKNGTGKSSLQQLMIHQAIQAGLGVCLIDPKGTSVRDILQFSIPAHRMDDVVVWDVKAKVDGTFYPPTFNLLAHDSRIDKEHAARRLMRVMATIYPEFADKRMADTLNMVLLTVSGAENPTLLDAIRLLEDVNFRDHLIAQHNDFMIRDYWTSFDLKSDGQQQELMEPILWRLRAFYNNKFLRSMTCHPDGMNLGDLIAQNKIVLVSLADPQNVMPEQERFVLGAALVAQFDMVVRTSVIQKPPFMLYIDEAQEFVDTDLPRMLSQVRQYGLGMVLANQYFRQLVGDTFDAIEGNVSTLISFEVGDRDAKALQNYMKPGFSSTDLLSLGVHKAAISLRYQQERQSAFSVETLAPPGHDRSDPNREMMIRRRSVENYTPKSYDDVMTWLNERYDARGRKGTDDGFFQ